MSQQPAGTAGEKGQRGAQDPGAQTPALPETRQSPPNPEAASFSPNSSFCARKAGPAAERDSAVVLPAPRSPWAPGKTSPALQTPLPAAPAIPGTQRDRAAVPAGRRAAGAGTPGGGSEQPGHGVTAAAPKEARGEGDRDRHIKDGGRGEPNGRPEHFQRRQAACCVYYERTGSPVPSGSCTRKRDKFRGAEFPRRAQRQLGAGGKETKPGAGSTSRLPAPRTQPSSKFNSKPPRQCQETPWPGTNSPPPQEQSKAAGCIVLQGAIKGSGKVSLEGGTGGCRCRQHPVTWEDESRGTHVCLSQQGGCTQAGG